MANLCYRVSTSSDNKIIPIFYPLVFWIIINIAPIFPNICPCLSLSLRLDCLHIFYYTFIKIFDPMAKPYHQSFYKISFSIFTNSLKSIQTSSIITCNRLSIGLYGFSMLLLFLIRFYIPCPIIPEFHLFSFIKLKFLFYIHCIFS